MKTLFFLFVGAVASICLSAQSDNNQSQGISYNSFLFPTSNSLSNAIASGKFKSRQERYKDIEGTPYLFDDFIPGTLVLNDGQAYNEIPLQMDIYTGDVIAKDEKGKEITLDPQYYKEYSIVSDNELFRFSRLHPSFPNRFYQILFESDQVSLFKEMEAKLQEGRNMGIAKTPSRFHHYKNYYLKNKGGNIIAIDLKEKELFKHFSDDEVSLMKEYMKENNLKLKKEEDFAKILAILKKA